MSYAIKHLYEFGPFHLDLTERVLFRDDRPLTLTPKATDLLLALVERHGRIVEKEELISIVWPETAVEESNLTHHISVLRKTLGEGENGQKFIETVPRRGYRFVADVRVMGSGDSNLVTPEKADFATSERDKFASQVPQPVPSASHQSQATTLAGQHWRMLLAAFIVLLGLTLVTAGGYRYLTRNKRISTEKTPIGALAVLPFVNVSQNPDVEYLSDGITGSLINALSQLPQLKVISYTSSFTYKSKEVDSQKVARELGVDAIVTGRVLQRGEDLLINVELVDARDRTQVWGEQYHHTTSDLLVVQSEISSQMATKLRLKLSNVEQQQLAKRETATPQAYELLIKGRFCWNKGGTDNQKKAIEYYQQAIAMDPAYALAYAELSISYRTLCSIGVLNPKVFKPLAEALVITQIFSV